MGAKVEQNIKKKSGNMTHPVFAKNRNAVGWAATANMWHALLSWYAVKVAMANTVHGLAITRCTQKC
eukprot:scaffold130384_cov15-Tisochrysis_lutea.AAC.2